MNTKKALFGPIFILAMGTGWLLNEMDIFPIFDWAWSILLGMIGAGILAARGINRLSFIFGVWFLVACVLSVFRQMGSLELKYEVPILVMAVGGLWFLAMAMNLPYPGWVDRAKENIAATRD